MAADRGDLRHHPRWGVQTGLWQWRQPALYLFLLSTLLGLLVIVAQQAAFLGFNAAGFVLSWALLLLYAVPVFALVYLLDLYEREPISLVIAALVWGGVGATTLSILGNGGWGLAFLKLLGPEVMANWAAALTAPWIEEITKALAVVFIYLIARREIDDVLDGFVYGAMAGLGFLLVEDVFYFMGAFEGTTEGILTGFYLRVVASGLYGHVLYSGLAGMGVAYFVTRRGLASQGRRYGVAIALFLSAMLAHFIWNSPLLDFFPEFPWEGGEWLQILWATAVKGMPILIFAVVMVRLAHAREHRWLETLLADEVGRPGLTREELEVLRTPRSRRRDRREAAARGGPGAARATKKLHREQINLAMVATRAHDRDHPDVLRQHDYCARLREWRNSLIGAREAARETPPTPPAIGEPPEGSEPPPPPPPDR